VRRKDLCWAIERGAALQVVRVSADVMHYEAAQLFFD
jgi:hypothetical protein